MPGWRGAAGSLRVPVLIVHQQGDKRGMAVFTRDRLSMVFPPARLLLIVRERAAGSRDSALGRVLAESEPSGPSAVDGRL